jgi:hypothetical protein
MERQLTHKDGRTNPTGTVCRGKQMHGLDQENGAKIK